MVAIAATSSVDFLESAFECYRTGQVFAICRPDTDLADRVATLTEWPAPQAPRHGWARLDYTPVFDDAPAQIVFTSGTEGRPKAIVLSRRNLADVVVRLNEVMQVTPEIREYVGVPVTYSFGLGRARAVAAAGGAVYVPERFDPSEIRDLLEAGEINAISAVPSLWSLILANPAAIGEAGRRVRWIEIGSQYMSGADKAAMVRLFPEARIVQHYGLTEASRTTFLVVSSETGTALESVGQATGSAEVRLDPEGAIAIRGDHVAIGRLDDDGRLEPLTDADGWLLTRDRGEIVDGRLHYRGRLDDQINVAGIKLAAEALEREIAALAPGAEGSFAVTGVPDAQRGEAVLLAVEDAAADRAELLAEAARIALGRRGIPARGALRTLRLADLPRTGTGKLRRAALRSDFATGEARAMRRLEAAPPAADIPLDAAESRLAQTWRRVAGPVALTPGHSFYDAGGDSLSSVQIGLVMEAEGYGRDRGAGHARRPKPCRGGAPGRSGHGCRLPSGRSRRAGAAIGAQLGGRHGARHHGAVGAAVALGAGPVRAARCLERGRKRAVDLLPDGHPRLCRGLRHRHRRVPVAGLRDPPGLGADPDAGLAGPGAGGHRADGADASDPVGARGPARRRPGDVVFPLQRAGLLRADAGHGAVVDAGAVAAAAPGPGPAGAGAGQLGAVAGDALGGHAGAAGQPARTAAADAGRRLQRVQALGGGAWRHGRGALAGAPAGPARGRRGGCSRWARSGRWPPSSR